MSSELLQMSKKELTRLGVIERLIRGELSQRLSAEQLGLTTRQIRNLQRAYQRDGASGLISQRRGRPSNNRQPEDLRQQAVELLRANYADFGPTLAHEKLTEVHGLRLSVERVRQLMIDSGLWRGKRRKKAHIHQMRSRRSCFGELIQIDGSTHDWFESRGPRCCLHVFVDDATSRLTALQFAPQECTQAYFDGLEYHLKHYGRPLSLYSDRHSIFRVNIAEANKSTGETQFSRAARELGIELICANSPQAKGRVERANGTLQDRLVKELRLRGISDIARANAFMPAYLAEYNARFAKPAANPADAHQKILPEPEVLALILSQQTTRKISKNLEVSYQNVLYQIQTDTPSYTMRGANLLVSDAQGKVTLLYKNTVLTYKTRDKKNQTTPVISSKQLEQTRKQSTYKPPASHPWRRYRVSTAKTQCQLNQTNT